VRLLLTNDDGVYAEGLHAVRRALEAGGRHELFIAAPERERSASSHAITLHKPIHVNAVHMDDLRSPAYAVSGTPADSTKIGILALMKERPDLVISGINRGANVGMDVLYSGTVSAAIEGVILGVPSIAVSVAGFEDLDYSVAARFVASLVDRLGQAPLDGRRPFLLNVNVPAVEADKVAGVAVTRLGIRYYTDVFHPRQDPRGRTYYWLAGEVRDDTATPDTDVWALAHNLISVTPLQLNLTDEALVEALRPWARGLFPEDRPAPPFAE
jgi:5'-nucleotidase